MEINGDRVKVRWMSTDEPRASLDACDLASLDSQLRWFLWELGPQVPVSEDAVVFLASKLVLLPSGCVRVYWKPTEHSLEEWSRLMVCVDG